MGKHYSHMTARMSACVCFVWFCASSCSSGHGDAGDARKAEVASSPPPKHEVDTILGLWETLTPTRTGLAQAMLFEDGGICYVAMIVKGDCEYRIENDTLIIDSGEEQTSVPLGTIARDEWKRERSGKLEVCRRLGGIESEGDLIQGVWTYDNHIGMVAFEMYGDDGGFSFRMPITGQDFAWSRLPSDPEKVVLAGDWDAFDGVHLRLEDGALVAGVPGEHSVPLVKVPNEWYKLKQ